MEEWASIGTLDAHGQSPHLKSFGERTGPSLASVQVGRYERLSQQLRPADGKPLGNTIVVVAHGQANGETGAQDSLQAALLAEASAEATGRLQHQVLRDLGDRSKFCVVEEWASAANLEQAPHGPFGPACGPWLAAPASAARLAASASPSSQGGDAARTLELPSGDRMPRVGLGCWKIGRSTCADVVYDAIKLGYRHLDGACDYGNEVEVGQGISRAIAEGLVRREELWVTSKLWNTYHAREHVAPACQRSLDDLGLAYLDLYLVHFPISQAFVPFETRYPPEWVFDPSAEKPAMVYAPVPFQETWQAMEALAARGLVRNVGVCNLGCAGLRDLLSYAVLPPATLQVERHVYLQQPNLVRFCADAGVPLTAFSPLGSSSYVELGMATAADSALADPAVLKLAALKGKSPAQVLLRWGLQRGAVVPKSAQRERLRENLDIFDFELTAAEVDELRALDKHKRFNDPADFTPFMNSFCPIYD